MIFCRICECSLESMSHRLCERIDQLGERLDLPPDRVIDCLAEYGNTSAASIPIALAEAASTGLLRKGSRVLLSAFGSGLTWGAGIVEWEGTA